MKKMLGEFREFAMRGNVVDLAVGVIIGAAFGKIVDSLVNDIIMPPIGVLLGKVDFSNLYVLLSGERLATLAETQAAGGVTLNYGVFINAIINFLIVALAVFFLIRGINSLQKAKHVEEVADEAAPAMKVCPFCFTEIPAKATRCPHCTSSLE